MYTYTKHFYVHYLHNNVSRIKQVLSSQASKLRLGENNHPFLDSGWVRAGLMCCSQHLNSDAIHLGIISSHRLKTQSH